MIDHSQYSDKEIIEKTLASGDLSFFGELYDRYANKVFRKCYAMVQNESDAQDLTQTILTKAMLNLSKFKFRSTFATWLYRITYNACLDFLRLKQKKRKVIISNVDFEHSNVSENEDGIESKKTLELEINRVNEIFEELAGPDRVLLLMKYQDGLTVPIIADQLKISESAVKMRLHRARKKVVETYKEKFN